MTDEPEILGPRVGSGNVAQVERVDLDRLLVGDRAPFVKMMADMIGCAPSADVIREWAAKYPDRYFYSLKMIGNLMGLADKVEHEGTIIHAVMNLPDADLMKKLEEMRVSMDHPMKDG
jgi:hypothetical protein